MNDINFGSMGHNIHNIHNMHNMQTNQRNKKGQTIEHKFYLTLELYCFGF